MYRAILTTLPLNPNQVRCVLSQRKASPFEDRHRPCSPEFWRTVPKNSGTSGFSSLAPTSRPASHSPELEILGEFEVQFGLSGNFLFAAAVDLSTGASGSAYKGSDGRSLA